MLQSGNDISIVKHWLGHADVNTTHGYVEIDMNMKRKALDACEPPRSAKLFRTCSFSIMASVERKRLSRRCSFERDFALRHRPLFHSIEFQEQAEQVILA